jgi:hypothetical protein
VFDGAHRSQNKVVVRRVEKQNARWKSDSSSSSSASPASSAITPIPSNALSEVVAAKPRGPIQWIVYSAPKEEEPDEEDRSLQLATEQSPWLADLEASSFDFTIPDTLKQDPQDASINFFFRHYTGIVEDNELHNNFSQVWQPLYLRTTANSPLRLATAAVTVSRLPDVLGPRHVGSMMHLTYKRQRLT